MPPSPENVASGSHACVTEANRLDKESFFTQHVSKSIAHLPFPSDTLQYDFQTSKSIATIDQGACLQLIKQTSRVAYEASNVGWSTARKREEMKEADMKYLLIRERSLESEDSTGRGSIQGFIQFMITIEDDVDVVYCYEIHLQAALRGKRIGESLMRAMEEVGASTGVKFAMLTVFVSNDAAIKFYKHIGYSWYDEEQLPPPKKLRGRVTQQAKPSYVILAKDLGKTDVQVKS